MIKKLLAALLVAAAAPVAFADEPQTGRADTAATKDIVETAVGAGKFTKLVAAVKAADLVDTLKGPGPFTVFAPTDEAFAALGDDKLKAVLADKEMLTKILMAHVVKDKSVMAKDVVAMDGKEVNGVMIKVDGEKVVLSTGKSKANVVKTDIKCKNGVIHVIDAVLVPDVK